MMIGEPTTKRWDSSIDAYVENEKVEAFIKAIDEVCRQHGLSISHEDEHGAFLIERFSQDRQRWLSEAHIQIKHEGVNMQRDTTMAPLLAKRLRGWAQAIKNNAARTGANNQLAHAELAEQAADLLEHQLSIINCGQEDICQWVPGPCLRHAKEFIGTMSTDAFKKPDIKTLEGIVVRFLENGSTYKADELVETLSKKFNVSSDEAMKAIRNLVESGEIIHGLDWKLKMPEKRNIRTQRFYNSSIDCRADGDPWD